MSRERHWCRGREWRRGRKDRPDLPTDAAQIGRSGPCSFQERWTCTSLPGAGKSAFTYSPLIELGGTAPRGFSPRGHLRGPLIMSAAEIEPCEQFCTDSNERLAQAYHQGCFPRLPQDSKRPRTPADSPQLVGVCVVYAYASRAPHHGALSYEPMQLLLRLLGEIVLE